MKYIVDTNVLLHKPEVIEEYDIVITSHVLREIENLERVKRSDRQLMFEIRRAKRVLRANKHYHIDLKDYESRLDFDTQYVDNIIMQACMDNGYGMLTNDLLLEEKCELYNVPLILLDDDHFIENKGYKEEFMLLMEVNEIYQNLTENKFNLAVNEYLIIYDDSITDSLEVLDIFKWDGKTMISLPKNKKGNLDLSFKSKQFENFSPKDAQQMVAIDSILSNQITQLRGRAGSGKSKIALETAWHLIERGDEGKKNGYDKLIIFVNPTPTRNAQELGFYSGDRLEKLMQSSVGTMLKSKFGDEIEIMRQMADGRLDILPFVDLRGYETGEKKTIVWILEAQNLTSDLMKLGLQRISENTKVIIDGDYSAQVDKDAYAYDNGMKRVSEVFRGEDLYGEIELKNIYRSRLADIADAM